jgi:putative ATP-binding cassette transporter
MDEATAALDELSQARMLEFLRTDLAGTMVLSVGHRPGLEAYHERTITLVREEGETAARAEQSAPLGWRERLRRRAQQAA